VKNLSEEERVSRIADFQRNVVVKYHAEFREFLERERKEADEMRLLRAINDHPDWPVTQLYRVVNLHGEDGVRAKSKLVVGAMAKEYVNMFVRKGSGARPIFVELLRAGVEVLESMGMTSVAMKGKGGFAARIYVHAYLKPWAERHGYRYEIEYWCEAGDKKKQIDFAFWDGFQRLHAVEVFVSGSANYCVESAVRCASIDGVHKVIVAIDDRKLMQRIKMMLRQELMPIQEKISVEWLGEYYCGDGE
jgi:hypothetical protein